MNRTLNRLSRTDIQGMYFKWLYQQVSPFKDRNPSHSHAILISLMHQTEFRYNLRNDKNRYQDGISLREEFADTTAWGDERVIEFDPCSFLEFMIGLSRRASYMDEQNRGADWWFWRMMDNAGLYVFTDEYIMAHDDSEYRIMDILNRIMDHRYAYNGEGGLFPLKHPPRSMKRPSSGIRCHITS